MKPEPIKSAALLVVDMQDVFLDAIPESGALLDRCCFAVEAAGLLGVRTFYTTQVPEKLGDLNGGLASLEEEPVIFPKTAFSGLRAAGLKEALAKAEVDHLILAGLETPICVYQTAIDATNDDLSVTILSDCIGGRRSDDRGPVLNALSQSGCHLLPSETVFYSIVGEAGHPAFKEFTKLVRKYHEKSFSET